MVCRHVCAPCISFLFVTNSHTVRNCGRRAQNKRRMPSIGGERIETFWSNIWFTNKILALDQHTASMLLAWELREWSRLVRWLCTFWFSHSALVFYKNRSGIVYSHVTHYIDLDLNHKWCRKCFSICLYIFKNKTIDFISFLLELVV